MIGRYTLPEMGELWSDEARLRTWLEVEIAAAAAMEAAGEIPAGTAAAIRSRARFDRARIAAIEERVHHDVIAFLTDVGESLGEERKYLHRGMTSSDLLDTALALTLVRAADLIDRRLTAVGRLLRGLAEAHRRTPMMGRTHGVHAEPISFGHKALVWFAEAERQHLRLRAAREEIRVGKLSGAVGTFAHLPPAIEERFCAALGLAPAPVSTQIVQRDRHAHLLMVLALIAATGEKIALEIRHLQRTEVGELYEPFAAGQKGSSAMPHKRNPILCERICGLARLLRAYAQVGAENIALWHERDISHSSAERVILPDACIALDYLLHLCERVLGGLEVDAARMRENLEGSQGLFFSQRALLALTEKLGSREEAYARVQAAAAEARRRRAPLRALLEETVGREGLLSADELDRICDLQAFLAHLDPVFERVLATGWARPGEA
ncbi:MAG: adenylosuccinate lyase, partial [Candidatus Eisenbacteria bacterium]|nr:adenylosuccinate lyase [Candidatus Eisenbacteria bacterium]